jgi:hypothetical protein
MRVVWIQTVRVCYQSRFPSPSWEEEEAAGVEGSISTVIRHLANYTECKGKWGANNNDGQSVAQIEH